MKAMILAAGRGERMRPLTDSLPKPLLKIAGKCLIEYHIKALVEAGIHDIVINHAWLGNLIEAHLGDGSAYNAHIVYSQEDQALETAGGIQQALPLLGDDDFIVVNGDVFSDYPFAQLIKSSKKRFLRDPSILAYLVLVNNPEHHPKGDFYCLDQFIYDEIVNNKQLVAQSRYTFSGIACYKTEFFSLIEPGKQALAPLLRQAIEKKYVSGEVYFGDWWDVGTPQRLADLNRLNRLNRLKEV